jgi:hypothetical protein
MIAPSHAVGQHGAAGGIADHLDTNREDIDTEAEMPFKVRNDLRPAHSGSGSPQDGSSPRVAGLEPCQIRTHPRRFHRSDSNHGWPKFAPW